MQKSLHIDPQKCTGCLQCEMACSYENEGIFNPSKSRIKVFTFHDQGLFSPYTCTQCAEAAPSISPASSIVPASVGTSAGGRFVPKHPTRDTG